MGEKEQLSILNNQLHRLLIVIEKLVIKQDSDNTYLITQIEMLKLQVKLLRFLVAVCMLLVIIALVINIF